MLFGSSVIPLYLIIVNLYLFVLMGYDKKQAKRKNWRVPEWNMLLMGVVGGGIGGLIAQRIFHHKTRKKYFYLAFFIGALVSGIFIVSYIQSQ